MIIAIVSIIIGLGAGTSVYFLIRRRRRGSARMATTMRVATPVGGRNIRQAIGDYKLIIISTAIVAAFLVFSMIGVEIKSSILIAVVGCVTAMYFTVISFWMETNPRRFEALLSKFGIALQNGQLTEGQAKALKELRFLAVPFAVLTAYLALVPSWPVYGYLFILIAIALALTLISYWKGWSSDVWRYVHRVTLFVFLGAFVIFAASVFLNESDAGKWVKQRVADYWNKPKPATPVPVPQSAKSAVMVQPMKSAPPPLQPKVEITPSPPPFGSELRTVELAPREKESQEVSVRPPAPDNVRNFSERDRLLDLAEKALDEDVVLGGDQADDSKKKKVESPKWSSYAGPVPKVHVFKMPSWAIDKLK